MNIFNLTDEQFDILFYFNIISLVIVLIDVHVIGPTVFGFIVSLIGIFTNIIGLVNSTNRLLKTRSE